MTLFTSISLSLHSRVSGCFLEWRYHFSAREGSDCPTHLQGMSLCVILVLRFHHVEDHHNAYVSGQSHIYFYNIPWDQMLKTKLIKLFSRPNFLVCHLGLGMVNIDLEVEFIFDMCTKMSKGKCSEIIGKLLWFTMAFPTVLTYAGDPRPQVHPSQQWNNQPILTLLGSYVCTLLRLSESKSHHL